MTPHTANKTTTKNLPNPPHKQRHTPQTKQLIAKISTNSNGTQDISRVLDISQTPP